MPMTGLAKQYDCGVYAITHVDSGKRYIGSSKNLNERMAGHANLLAKNNHHNQYLQFAYNKYGKDAFAFEPILICSPESRTYYEQLIMDGYDATNMVYGYNLSLTASHPTHSSKTRKKISNALVRARANGKTFGHHILHTEKTKDKIKERLALAKANGKKWGNHKPHTEEAKSKMSKSKFGQIAWNEGIAMSDSAKTKMIKTKKELFNSPEFLEKWNARKPTHCKYGHEFAGDNLLTKLRGGWNLRICRKCRNYRKKKCLDKKKGIL